MTTVREGRAALYRPKGVYGDLTRTQPYGFQSSLCMLGDEVTREYLAKMVFYRNRKQSEDAGMSWWGTDVLAVANAVLPHDLSPVWTDPRLCHLPACDREEPQVSRETLRLAA